MKRSIKVAAAQLPGLPLASAEEVLPLIEQAVADAAGRKVKLLVLPECAYPAYHLGSREAYDSADIIDNKTLVEKLCSLAAKHKITLVCGFVEQEGDKLYNSAIVIGGDGRECGRYRKTFLWGEDNNWFERGRRLAPIDTPVGKIGIVICADARAPETASAMVAQGAELIAIPTCWVNVASEPGGYRNAQAEFMIEGRAIECKVPIVAANKFGQETEDVSYCGWSQIVDDKGKVLAKASPNEAEIIDAEVSIGKPPKLEIPDWAERRIFCTYPPIEPDREELDLIKIAVAPSALTTPLRENERGLDLFQEFSELGVRIVTTCLRQTDVAENLDTYGRSLGMAVIGYPFVERLMIEEFGSFGCVASEHVDSFIPARLMALDGASIVFVVGDEVPVPLLRTRAAENRIFIAAADADSAILIGPAGDVIDQASASDARPIIAEIDLRETADKYVYPATHIWEQRQPEIYARAFGVEANFRH